MKRLFARLVAMFRRGAAVPAPVAQGAPVPRPVLQFALPDGRLDDPALTDHISRYWEFLRGELCYQSAVLIAALRRLAPGAVGLHWAEDSEYGDEGYFTVLNEVTLVVRMPDGREVKLGLPDYPDLHSSEFEYWNEADNVNEAIDAELADGEEIDDEERERRFFLRLQQHYGLVGVTDDETLHSLGSIAACLIDFTRGLDTGRTCVPSDAFALLPPVPTLPAPEAADPEQLAVAA